MKSYSVDWQNVYGFLLVASWAIQRYHPRRVCRKKNRAKDARTYIFANIDFFQKNKYRFEVGASWAIQRYPTQPLRRKKNFARQSRSLRSPRISIFSKKEKKNVSSPCPKLSYEPSLIEIHSAVPELYSRKDARTEGHGDLLAPPQLTTNLRSKRSDSAPLAPLSHSASQVTSETPENSKLST